MRPPCGGVVSFGRVFVLRSLAKKRAGRPLTQRERDAIRWARDLKRAQVRHAQATKAERAQMARAFARVPNAALLAQPERTTRPTRTAPRTRSPRRAPRQRRTSTSRDDGGSGEPGEPPPSPALGQRRDDELDPGPFTRLGRLVHAGVFVERVLARLAGAR